MLKDDIELLTGKIIVGEMTPALFLLLKDMPHMDTLCADIGIERAEKDDNTRGTITIATDADSGAGFQEWLTNTAKPVSV